MNRSSAELKKLARATLPGKFGTFIGTFVIFQIIAMTSSIIVSMLFVGAISPMALLIQAGIQLILSFIFLVFEVGFMAQALKACRGEAISISNLFHGFTHHPDKFIVVSLLQILIMLVLFIPGIILIVISSINYYSNYTTSIIGLLLLLVGYIVAFIILLGFGICYYLIIDNPEMTAIDSLKESWKLMKGHKGSLFYLSLSFFGWALLGILSFGIGFLWITPYMSVTSAYFYLDLIGELNPVQPSTMASPVVASTPQVETASTSIEVPQQAEAVTTSVETPQQVETVTTNIETPQQVETVANGVDVPPQTENVTTEASAPVAPANDTPEQP